MLQTLLKGCTEKMPALPGTRTVGCGVAPAPSLTGPAIKRDRIAEEILQLIGTK